ncbi:hypothetical protein L1887_30823 [Cichorium endivia]|nr:hypothetical protein L1887_30823 [Cichorium endivia]
MAETKKLIVVVDNTAALGPYWATIISDYLEKIIRSFCGDEDTEAATPRAEFALVNYTYPCSVKKRGWTDNVYVFMEWLCAINCNGYLSNDAPITEALTEVLKFFDGSQNHEKHCILVASNNPPPDLCDAETVAKSFPRCLVSLSVISPRRLPKLEAIYNAAKRNPLETDFTIDNMKNPYYLLLISQDFMEARAALSQPEITNLSSNQSPKIIDLNEPITGSSMASASSSSSSTSQKMTTSRNIIARGMTSSVPVVQSVSQQTSKPLIKFAKIWEAFRDWSDSLSVAKDWPRTLQIERLLLQKDVKNEKYIGKSENVFFRAKNEHSKKEHSFIEQMREKKLYSVVTLPSQTMLLYSACIAHRLIGMFVNQISEEGDVQDSSQRTQIITSESFLIGTE